MKFDKNYDYHDFFNNIRLSTYYHGYLIGYFHAESIQNTIQEHWARSLGAKKI